EAGRSAAAVRARDSVRGGGGTALSIRFKELFTEERAISALFNRAPGESRGFDSGGDRMRRYFWRLRAAGRGDVAAGAQPPAQAEAEGRSAPKKKEATGERNSAGHCAPIAN